MIKSETTESRNYINKDETTIIKGIALLFMFIHHFFTCPAWYVEGVNYPELVGFAEIFREPFRICVSIYAFISGYSFFFSKKKYKYVFKKISDVWMTYFVSFLVFVIPATLLGTYTFSIKSFLLEAFALERSVLNFCWYIVFYIVAMLLMPIYAWISERSPFFAFGLTMILPNILLQLFYIFVPQEYYIYAQIPGYLTWFPCMACGFLFAENRLFDGFDRLMIVKERLCVDSLCTLIALAVMLGRNYSIEYDFIYAPIFLYCTLRLIRNCNVNIIKLIFSYLGKQSLLMWITSSLFFDCMYLYTQRILYLPHNPILVLLWGLSLCYLMAIILSLPINRILSIKNSLLK